MRNRAVSMTTLSRVNLPPSSFRIISIFMVLSVNRIGIHLRLHHDLRRVWPGYATVFFDAFAEVASAEEFELGMRLLDKKYLPWKQLLNISAMLFRRLKRIVIVIRLVSSSACE